MSTLVIAKKDFKDAIRARTLQLLVAFFVGFTTLVFHYHRSRLGEEPTFTTLFDGIIGMLGVVVPVLGMMVGYKAIVGERESGSLKLLLALPHSRRDVMLGKFLGRSAIVVVTMAVGFVLIGIQTILFTDLFSLTKFLFAAGEITLFGIMFVAIAMAFSTAMRSSMTASIGALGLTILFSFLWDFLYGLFAQFVDPIQIDPETGWGSPDPGPNWLFLLKRLNPRQAFYEPSPYEISEPIPFYLDPWFGWVIVVAWLVVPLGLAYLRFRNSDLT
ncbi:ABC transporter permease [Halocatena salina]|uniref:ABC transporter permease n=1 Tax=Halocatena salina TaxID=2934340 RepID=A0A8U0A787_9EURY|nr:ABC transporter permease [Halocatena salina]UPM44972.1 ABC transporter permease [Halocatena salina]